MILNSSKDKVSSVYYTGHGSISGTLAYNAKSASQAKTSNGKTMITKMDLDFRLMDGKGTINLYFDNCFALPELSKGQRADSSDSNNPSFFSPTVDMSYFTMVLAYTWNQHRDRYSSLMQVAEDLAKNSASLPSDVKELMGYEKEAFDSITVHQEAEPLVPLCEKVDQTQVSPLFLR